MAAEPDLARRRLALLIATSEYTDLALRRLRAPGRDASDLAEVLRSPQIGGFVVQTLINARCSELLEAIEDFCADRRLDDQLLIYLSCHGVLDDRGRLYYAATDTRRQRTAATAVAAAWLNERLEDSRSRSQIVILDCCHSGAFASGAKGESDLALEQRFRPHGRGRIVLTASRGTEYSFEGDQPSGKGMRSVFTQAIVDGLRTGDADRDKDGLITVSDIYHYAYDRVRAVEPRQTPELWTYGAEGDVVLAHSVRGAIISPVPLAEDLRLTLESPRPRIRETAVAELAELLDTAPPGLALSAQQTLERVSTEDIPRVAAVARVALEASQGTAAREVSKELTQREQRNRLAEQQAVERKAEEEAVARRLAEQQAVERKAEEEAVARRLAEQQAVERKAEEEAVARRLAEQQAVERKAEEEAVARRLAEQQAVERKAEEEAVARRLAEQQAVERKAEEEAVARREATRVGGFERVLASLAYLLPILALIYVLPSKLRGRVPFGRNSFIRLNAIQALMLVIIGFVVPLVTIGPAYHTSHGNAYAPAVSQPWFGILLTVGTTVLCVSVILILFCLLRVIQGRLPKIILLTRMATRLAMLMNRSPDPFTQGASGHQDSQTRITE